MKDEGVPRHLFVGLTRFHPSVLILHPLKDARSNSLL